MDPETKRLLQENLALSKETNELLKKMVSAQRWGRVFHLLYWVLIIGGSVGVYYWLQPFLGPILGNYDSIMNGLDKVQQTSQSIQDSSPINSILDRFR